MDTIKASVRLSPEINSALDEICKQDSISKTALIAKAIQVYLDHRKLNTPGSHLPEWQHQQTMAGVDAYAHKTNHQYSQLLSSIAIDLHVLMRIIADNIEVPDAVLREYTLEAVEMLKQNNRILRFEEMPK